ncbi:MAG: ABC transporter substrate-binding protein [Desulfocapsa sp.]|nr:ABC transporter substrate-binding protein [Desulfocapsa sp.]
MTLSKLLSLWFLISYLFLLSGQAYAKEFPRRIVSLGPINTENVFLLEAGDRLVANTNYCVRPEAARHKEKIGSVMQVSIEKIISQHPDLVLATALTKPEQVRQLQAVGIKVVRFKRTASFKEICNEFIRLGELLGLEDRARAIVYQAQVEVAKVQKKVFPLTKKKVFLQVGSQPLFGAVTNSFTHDFIVLAGGINILAEQKSGTTGIEKVIGENPDVIIIAIMGSESGIAADEKKNWQRISVIKAVQEDRVHVINPDLVCSPSPATFAHTLRIIAGLIHPELTTGRAQ